MSGTEQAEILWLDSEHLCEKATVFFVGVRHKDDAVLPMDFDLLQDAMRLRKPLGAGVLGAAVDDEDIPAHLVCETDEWFGVFPGTEEDQALGRVEGFEEEIFVRCIRTKMSAQGDDLFRFEMIAGEGNVVNFVQDDAREGLILRSDTKSLALQGFRHGLE